MDSSPTQTFRATGLTCGHCGAAVTDEISALPGVTHASVEVVRDGESVISVVADRELGTEEISGALDEAGDYHLVR